MKRFLKYAAVGLSGVVVNEGLLFLLTEYAGLFFLISSVIAIEISIISNFTWNELWTFKDRTVTHRNFPRRLGKFNLVSVVGIVLNLLVLYVITTFFGFHY
ncbi:MAG: GtrA family protein, partial [Candidatus Aenigmatarchaeota archaeon]